MTETVQTIEDIARLAGVSAASVSRALNGRPGVSARTRASILKIAKEHAFTGNHIAKALKEGRSGRVAVTLPWVQSEYYARILGGASEVLYQHDASMFLATTVGDVGRETRVLGKLLNGGIDGALLMLPRESDSDLRVLLDSGIRFVIIDPVQPVTVPVPSITCTNALGARQAVEHLIALGHRRIGVVAGESELLVTADRLHGFRQAMSAARLTVDERLVEHASYITFDDGAEAAGRLLSASDRPSAIFALNDRLAFGVLRAARRLGIDVPEELSVVGFDDLEMTELVTPTLTSVRQPLARMGSLAAELLMRWIAGEAPSGMHVELPTTLIERDSTAPAPGAQTSRDTAPHDQAPPGPEAASGAARARRRRTRAQGG